MNELRVILIPKLNENNAELVLFFSFGNFVCTWQLSSFQDVIKSEVYVVYSKYDLVFRNYICVILQNIPDLQANFTHEKYQVSGGAFENKQRLSSSCHIE